MKSGGVAMLEEATGLLRALPARSWILWLAGTLPFTWALIDFLMEMRYSAFGGERLAARCLLLSALFAVKHTAQGLFSQDCLRVLRGDRPAWPGAAAAARLALVQMAWQPLRLPALALAGIAIVPYPWVAAFLRNVGLAAVERERGFVREAWRLARGDTRAHTVALLVLTMCWLLLFANLLALWFVIPMLLKGFFGWQTAFTHLAERLLNATTLLVTAILAFAALEPVPGALAAIRAFHAEARHTGADLLGALRRMAVAAAAAIGTVWAQTPALDKGALDRRIDAVLRDPEFAWKMPKAAVESGGDGWLRSLLEAFGRMVQWLSDLFKRLFSDNDADAAAGAGGWSVNAQAVQWAMIAAAVLAAGCVVFLLLSRRREARAKAAAPAPSASAAVDLKDEGVSPGELPEDEWLRMAERCAAGGDYRLAMRAVHLAGLRYLGERGWVTLQPAKTGMEYGRELARRLREAPSVIAGFGRGLRQYEEVWYGFGAAEAASYQALRAAWEEMRRHA